MRSSFRVKKYDKADNAIEPEDETETEQERITRLEKEKKFNQDSLKRRHDLAIVLNKKCKEEICEAIMKDLDNLGFDALLVETQKGQAKLTKYTETDYVVLEGEYNQRVIFVAYNDTNMLLREAETLRMRKFKRPYDQKTYDKEKKAKLDYLDPRVVKYEEKDFFKFSEKNLYEGGEFETILSEAEIGLCAYKVLTSIQLKKGAKN